MQVCYHDVQLIDSTLLLPQQLGKTLPTLNINLCLPLLTMVVQSPDYEETVDL